LNTTNSSKKGFGKHAVVIGGSIAGMVAGRVLTDFFEQVTIIERDSWDHRTEAADFRKGVPQARHPHILLKRGELIFEELFPGLGNQLKAKGAVPVNMGDDLAWFTFGNWRPRYESSLTNLACSRPMLESTIRQRLSGPSNLNFKAGWEVTGLQANLSQTKAQGVKVRSRDGNQTEQLIPADFIVDASGRGSRASEWLETMGYTLPRETVINALPGYATRIYKRPANFQRYWKSLYIQPTPPNEKRGAIILPMEGDRWHVTLIGMNQDYPPTDEERYLEFARNLATPELIEAIKEAEPVTPIIGFRSGSNRLKHFEELPDYLENFVALGDSVYAFNPVYGQGMTVAAMSGIELRNFLQERQQENENLAGLAGQFQKRLMEVITVPWQVATGEDMRWPETTGIEPSFDPEAALMQNYLGQVMFATTKTPAVTEAFYRVMNIVDPPSLFFRPDLVLQVAAETARNLKEVKTPN
jgi:2-polyprenyl-6-methoxyphenol hydroxylase-like FAD-dependent oxidoreductase